MNRLVFVNCLRPIGVSPKKPFVTVTADGVIHHGVLLFEGKGNPVNSDGILTIAWGVGAEFGQTCIPVEAVSAVGNLCGAIPGCNPRDKEALLSTIRAKKKGRAK